MGATDRAAHALRYYGCLVVDLYNTGRPHSALGPGVPDPPQGAATLPKSKCRHQLAADAFVRVKRVLGGLHHEYSLATV